MDCKNESNKLNKIAVHILETPKPSINLSAKSIIKAFTTSKNNPSVTIVIGKVSIIKIGLTNTFKIASTNATIRGVVNVSSIDTPGNNFAKITTAIALNTSFINNFIYLNFCVIEDTKYYLFNL